MLLSSVLLCIYLLSNIHTIPVASSDVGFSPSMLSLPRSNDRCVTYSASNFCDAAVPGGCLQGKASVRSLELRKFTSWTNWRHEFFILMVTHQELDYFIHVNRAWAGTGWWEYIPYLTWGSTKTAENAVSIYLPGEEEVRERDGTELLIQINFDSGIRLRDIANHLAPRVNIAGPYSLFGMNCWTYSRYLTLEIVRKWKNFILDVQMPKRGGQVDVTTLWMELALDPWVHWGQFVTYKAGAIRPSMTRRILHGIGPAFVHLYDKYFPEDTLFPWLFIRPLEIIVTSEGTHDFRGFRVNDVPHIFARQWAVDSDNSTYSNSLSFPGDFLYLLTAPLLVRAPVQLVGIQVFAKSMSRTDEIQYSISQCVWFESAIVRHDLANGMLRVASERSRIPWNDSDLHWMDKKYPFVRQLESGDMIGVWARVQCVDWANQVKSITLNVLDDKFCRKCACCSQQYF